MAGLTPDGFTSKSYEQVLDDMFNRLEADVGEVDRNPTALLGQIFGTVSTEIALLWNAGQDVYNMFNPDTAVGVQLDGVVQINGLRRLAATKSSGIVQACGDEGTVLATGRIVSVTQTGDQFTSTADVIITASEASEILVTINSVLNNTLYSITVDAVPYDYTSDADATAAEITAGLAAALAAGPFIVVEDPGISLRITSDDVNNQFPWIVTPELTISEICSNMPVEAVEFGPVLGLANTVTTIVTPISGWLSVNNATDLNIGRNIETDVQLRARRQQSISTSTGATIPAIRAFLNSVDGVSGVSVTENATKVVDPAGRPPSSIECVVFGGEDQDIFQALWDSHGGGIETFGNTSGFAVDEEGNSQPVSFSRAVSVYVWVRVTINSFYDEEVFPANGEDQIKEDVVEYGQTFDIGEDVIPQRFYCAIYQTPGIENITVELTTSPTPVGPPGTYLPDPIQIEPSELALFDVSRVEVVLPP
jgi:uncharacterized phage protein gp47/JayE